jgi:hypothetical protein
MSENHGGARANAGRKPIEETIKANIRIKGALKLLYNNKEDEDNILELLKRFADTKEGMRFMAEHLLGKPTQQVESTNLTYSTEITVEEARIIAKVLEEEY